MTSSTIRFCNADHAALDAFLVDRLYDFNAAATGLDGGELLAAAIRGDGGDVIAAATGHTWGGTCYVAHLWVAQAQRRAGLGRALIAAIEAEARRRGCGQVLVATHSFQAPGFYERLGYEQRARIDDYPRGRAQLHYVKRLRDAGA